MTVLSDFRTTGSAAFSERRLERGALTVMLDDHHHRTAVAVRR